MPKMRSPKSVDASRFIDRERDPESYWEKIAMAFNVPTYHTDRLSFGPGVIFIGTAGATPTTDIGAVDEGMTLTHGVELLDVRQGNPGRLIKSFRTSDSVTFAFSGFEWNLDNLPKLLGAGHTSGDEFGYGGDLSITEVSLKLVHQMPPKSGAAVGSTVIIEIWKARANGDLTMTFGADLHSFPVTFSALHSTQNWWLEDLDSGHEYYRMTYQQAP
jgi:hypothetical protein